MLTKEQVEKIRQKAVAYFEKAEIVLTNEEKQNIEIADFGLNDIENTTIGDLYQYRSLLRERNRSLP